MCDDGSDEGDDYCPAKRSRTHVPSREQRLARKTHTRSSVYTRLGYQNSSIIDRKRQALTGGPRVAPNVKRWRGGDQSLRWTTPGLLEAERKFRRMKGYRELEVMSGRLNPQCSCDSCQEHRWRESQLHYQEEV